MDASDILKLVAALLSVPVVTALVNLAARIFLPAQRLRSTLKVDLALYNEMPESDAKDAFREHIERAIVSLNGRLQPERWNQRKLVAQRTFGVIGAAVALVGGITLIISGFLIANASGTLPVVSAIITGAGTTFALLAFSHARTQNYAAKAATTVAAANSSTLLAKQTNIDD